MPRPIPILAPVINLVFGVGLVFEYQSILTKRFSAKVSSSLSKVYVEYVRFSVLSVVFYWFASRDKRKRAKCGEDVQCYLIEFGVKFF